MDEKCAYAPDADQLRRLILGMRAAYAQGENAMQWARGELGVAENVPVATLIAYDLQAGSYIAAAQDDPAAHDRWCRQIASVLEPYVTSNCSILEVGCGEATTLAGMLGHLASRPQYVLGLDISWSRCAAGSEWLAQQQVTARLMVGDLFRIPLADESVDVVYTSHSLEPNGGREEEAIRELLRVARRAVVLVEPIYELANPESQARMRRHKYVSGLKRTAERLGCEVSGYRLLPHCPNPLNPSGVLQISKSGWLDSCAPPRWQCPLTQTPLVDVKDAFVSPRSGLAYPVLRNIPLLRIEHALMASLLREEPSRQECLA